MTAPRLFRRRLQGLQRTQLGDSVQEIVAKCCARYRELRLATFFESRPQVRQGKEGLVYTKKGGPDFVGVYQGIPMAFDVKSCAGAASFAYTGQTAKQLHQVESLIAFNNSGGFGFLVLLDAMKGRLAIVHDAVDLGRLKAGGRVTLRVGAEYIVPTVTESPILDLARGEVRYNFLPVAEALFLARTSTSNPQLPLLPSPIP